MNSASIVKELRTQREDWFSEQPGTTPGFGSLAGKTVLVTGYYGGLGQAISSEVRDAGAFVIGTDLPTGGQRMDRDDFAFIPADLRDREDAAHLVRTVSSVGLNALVNNAGVMAEVPLADTDEALWGAALDVNLTSAYRLSRGLLDALRQEATANIVNVSSQLAYTGGATLTAYGASKAGLIGLTRSLARELGPSIRVNAIAPGPVVSPMTEAHMTEEWVARKTANLIAGRMGEAREIATVVRFLLSDAASFIYGQTLSVNGGGHLS
ncbi:SDR family oxidoreductase [Cryobacterium sp. Hh7]|uniref:SDR family NAD(P)-dependent oxidoreductase n=1 Tax=Cryobacterium sp. Hh7 TaxID=1259159 RepID=UPI00106ABECD|nr:SDR family NAD(P)-dependent oxidoreductase [Cryobacterium sp. Hh7]TFD50726.1 SDR family oxidoreductase [Cryobacterium sp. Hh7]